MTWIPRPLAPNLCYHVRVQCNNRAFRFETENDFAAYLDLLVTAKEKLHFLLHHFALMHTHVHLILTTPGPVLLDRIMQFISLRYAVDYHRRHLRTGHFWMHGYRSSVINTDAYALTCMRYLDRNAPRARLVQHPAEWKWCAYHYYGLGKSMPLIDPHESYLALATSPEQRRIVYRDFVMQLLPSDEIREKEMINTAMRRWTRSIPKKTNT